MSSLAQIRSQLIERISEVTSKPKPNYDIDGQKVDWQSYLDSLCKQLKAIDERIEHEELATDAGQPYEYVSRGIT